MPPLPNSRLQHFNSHPHKEDDTFADVPDRIKDISTHILTRRMTQLHRYELRYCTDFNSHPHKEDDCLFYRQEFHFQYFNSHPHKEDDSNFKQK